MADTVADEVYWFSFGRTSVHALTQAIGRALDAFGRKKRRNAMRQTAMMRDRTWNGAAQDYSTLYARAFGKGAPRQWQAA